MARVTVEDCIERIPNRFELVLAAGRRARELSAGAAPTIERSKDKNPVIALREIAADKVDPEALKESTIRNLQQIVPREEEEEDLEEFLAREAEKDEAGLPETDIAPLSPPPSSAVAGEAGVANEPEEPVMKAAAEDFDDEDFGGDEDSDEDEDDDM